jgi:hypothetical protein
VNRFAAIGCVLFVIIAAPSVAGAQVSHSLPVELRFDPSVESCVGDLETVRRAVVIDLGAELVADDRVDATHVEVTCTGDEATIRVDDPLTGKIVERRISLGPFAGRARVLGLVIAETVAASWVELEMVGSEEPHPDAVAPPQPTIRSGAAAVALARLRAHRPRTAPMPTLGLAAVVRVFGRDDLVTTGARLDGTWPVGARFAIGLDVAGEWGRVSADAGDVDVSSISIAPRLATRVSAAGIELGASLGFRLGLVDLSGKSKTADVVARSFLAPWGGPVVDLEARAGMARHFGVALGLEAGRVTLEVQGQLDGARAAGISGWWAGAWLSFAYLP